MARALRIIEPGLWHHVTNRGLNRAAIFGDHEDREVFLERLGECAARWQVDTGAYALLDTEFHLLLRDNSGGLSRAMRHLTGVYTQLYNRKHGREGPLLRGRFRDRLVQAHPARWLGKLARHLHTLEGPVDGFGMVPTETRSSLRYYSSADRPTWLSAAEVLAPWGGDSPAGRRRFEEFTLAPVDGELRDRLQGVPWHPLLGDEDFVQYWRHRLRSDPRYVDAEVPDARRLRAWTVDEIVSAACEVFGLGEAALMASARGRLNLPRMVCMMVCRDRSGATLREIGERFGVSPGAVSALASRTRARIADDPDGRQLEAGLLERLARPPARDIRPDPTGLRDHIGRIAE